MQSRKVSDFFLLHSYLFLLRRCILTDNNGSRNPIRMTAVANGDAVIRKSLLVLGHPDTSVADFTSAASHRNEGRHPRRETDEPIGGNKRMNNGKELLGFVLVEQDCSIG